VIEIEQRYLAGAYTRQEIAFDPHSDGGQDWTTEYADIPYRRPIPELMYNPTMGRLAERSREYVEGYSPGVDIDDGECCIAD
jgi:hypothetical protein